jgi:hypothetical protein
MPQTASSDEVRWVAATAARGTPDQPRSSSLLPPARPDCSFASGRHLDVQVRGCGRGVCGDSSERDTM